MPATVTVYPTKASALNVKHPHGPQMELGGVIWPKDSFTGRRLSDGSATTDKTKAYEPNPAAPANVCKAAAPAKSAEPAE